MHNALALNLNSPFIDPADIARSGLPLLPIGMAGSGEVCVLAPPRLHWHDQKCLFWRAGANWAWPSIPLHTGFALPPRTG